MEYSEFALTTILISGDGFEALKCLERMLSEGLSPNVVSFHLHFKDSHILQRGF